MSREIAGVTFPDAVTAAGRPLRLNGAGLRTRLMFKVYAIGLYLERTSSNAAAILAADEVRRVDLHLLRALTGAEIGGAIGDAFAQNAGPDAAALDERLGRLRKLIPPKTAAGDVLTLTYSPGKGTAVAFAGKELGTIEGKDFSDALLSVWLGSAPIDPSLKGSLLTA